MINQVDDLAAAFCQLAEKPGAGELRADFQETHRGGNPPTIAWRICGDAPRYVIGKFRVLAAQAGKLLAACPECSAATRAVADPVERWLMFVRDVSPNGVNRLPAQEFDDEQLVGTVFLGTISDVIRESEIAAARLQRGTDEPPAKENLSTEDALPVEGLVTLTKITERFDLNHRQKERLRKRLDTWRKNNPGGGWIEVADRKQNQDGYLYPMAQIRPLIEAVKSSSNPPAKKIFSP